ncbi:restriction endonuclease subunit S [Aerococcaceae bacterium NML190073]|nr:restriction endonuclease subunit S [Aerococcaceae bacterium NML190073]
MNKIEELIQQLCPNGVEYKELGEVCAFNRGQSLSSKNAVEGDIPVISGGQKPAFMHNVANRPANTIVIAGSGAYAGFVSYWDKPIFCSDAFSVDVIDESQTNTRYVYHYLLNNQEKIYSKKRGAGIPHVYGKDLSKFIIPLPPLEIQKEIVKTLDKFTKYVTELTSELTSELTFRKQQYSYYRDKLLSFEDSDVKVEWKTLDDMFEIIAGGDVPKDAFSEYKTSDYSIPILSNGIGENAIYGWTNIAKIEKPSLTISARGTIGWTSFQDKPFVPIVRLLVLTPKSNINLKYAYYFMKSIECNYDIPQSGIPQLTKPMIRNKLIPIPPLHIQEKIVEVLDNFDKVCNDLNIGLPKEIEQRQQQYEYYRDLLLTFDVNNGSLPACLPACLPNP